jgi:fatty acid desaturase
VAIDIEAFAKDLAAIKQECGVGADGEDLAHLRRMERWTWTFTALGYATAWIAPNPISILCLSTGRFARWTMLSHHVVHQGYDRVENVPARYTSAQWAVSWRRFVDWFDWMHPDAWRQEHNVMHHYRLGEVADPDLVEERAWLLRDPRVPKPIRYLGVATIALLWKPLYYAPTTMRALHQAEQKRKGEPASEVPVDLWSDWNPLQPVGRQVWLKSWLPYGLFTFVLVPALFLPLGWWFSFSMLVNTVLADLLTNLHAFIVVAPNHTGDDMWRFDGRYKGKDEFLLRQVVGSVNYACGDDRTDFLHGFLNYQIEHHLYPTASMLQLRRMQPRIREACERHGVPYVQESVWLRVRRLVDILVGNTSMKRLPEGASLVEALDEPVAERIPA